MISKTAEGCRELHHIKMRDGQTRGTVDLGIITPVPGKDQVHPACGDTPLDKHTCNKCRARDKINCKEESLNARTLPHTRSQKDGVTPIPESLYDRWEGKPLGNLIARSEALAELGS